MDVMDPCELYENWDQMAETSEILDGLQDLANEIVGAWGLEGVTVVIDEVPGNSFGEYDPNTNVITIDPDHLSEADEAFDTVFHEAIHAVHDQWGFSAEEVEALHEFTAADAAHLAKELVEDCKSTDPVESAPPDIPDIPGGFGLEGEAE
ncbi:hypothetical protein [Nonomuraea roseola]|uniref:ImmA/IrrE family metallo-endopeptidase n=1 Tax=Nonomuraea roseola TaxID=46179 RepID=A0ABV5QGB4_9ACTN